MDAGVDTLVGAPVFFGEIVELVASFGKLTVTEEEVDTCEMMNHARLS